MIAYEQHLHAHDERRPQCARQPGDHRVHARVPTVDRMRTTLAPALPLSIPVPLARGVAGAGYPWSWSVYRWLPGDDLASRDLASRDLAQGDVDPVAIAQGLASFAWALRAIDPAGGPPPGAHNFYRGVPLVDRSEATLGAIAELGDAVDQRGARKIWEAPLELAPWTGPGRWIHGDLQPGSLLVRGGRLSAVIDFGGLAVADPAVDLMPAWTLFGGRAHERFRRAAADPAMWQRGRAWALSTALVALPYYRTSNLTLAGQARRTIERVLADERVRG